MYHFPYITEHAIPSTAYYTCKKMPVGVSYILQRSSCINYLPKIRLQNDIKPTLIKTEININTFGLKLMQTIAIFMSLRKLP
jgi:hypothetical protein